MTEKFQITHDANIWQHACNICCVGARHADVGYVDVMCHTDGEKLQSLRELEEPLGIIIHDVGVVREPYTEGTLYSPRPDEMPSQFQPVLLYFSFIEPEVGCNLP